MAKNVWQLENRFHKAKKLLAALSYDITVNELDEYHAVDWWKLAQKAQVNVPSHGTIMMVREMVEARQEARDRYAKIDDAFASLGMRN